MSEQGETTHDQAQGETAPRPRRRRNGDDAAERRDATAARQAAQDRVAQAEQVARSVEQFHNAADRIDEANAELARANEDRLTAIREMRASKLTISEISALTGLSSSRIQALTKDTSSTA